MPQKRYDSATQRRAVEQVLLHHRSIAQVARQLHCSSQSVQKWIKRHRDTVLTPSFLPLQVEDVPLVPSHIELVTKTGLTLRFSVDTRLDTLLDIVQRLEVA